MNLGEAASTFLAIGFVPALVALELYTEWAERLGSVEKSRP